MYKKLRLNLTFLCTGFTGFILFAMACFSLMIAQRQLRMIGRDSFHNSVSSIRNHIRSQNILDHTWISQTENGNDLILYVEISGSPLYYTMIHRTDAEKALIEEARNISEEKYGLFISKEPLSRVDNIQETFTIKREGLSYYGASMTVPLEKGWVGIFVIKSMSEEAKQLRYQRTLFMTAGGAALCLLFLFAWFFTGRTIKPIEINRRRQLEFVHAASHELRSPLAVIQTSLSAILADGSMEEVLYYAKLSEGECIRMSRLIKDMLLLAGADDGSWSIHSEETEIETLMLTAFESFEEQAAAKNIFLHISLPEEPLPRCRCDGQRIIQVLSILLDNGISYTQEGGDIWMEAEKKNKSFYLTVADNGPGIPKEARNDIFNRFYRLDEARAERQHFGLGLSIAKEIAVLHRGRLFVEDRPGGGARFVLELTEG